MRQSLFWLILIPLIFIRYQLTRPVYKNGDTVRITTTIYSDPISYTTSQYIKIAGLKTYLPKYPEVSYGDKIVIEGVVEGNDHGKPDKLKNPKLVRILNKTNFLSDLRNSIISFYKNLLPEPMAGLLGGIVLGAKGSLDQNFYDQTKLAGVAHVVVASGTNVTFVISFLISFLTAFLPRRKAILFVILGIITYLFVSGFDAPLVRASIMASFIFLGQVTGRIVNIWRVFFLTALIMLLYNPGWTSDIGFILSFVSTASLMLFEKKIKSKLKIVPEILKEGLSTSLAAQIGVAPILFVTFGQFNIFSPIINALVLWVVPLVMVLGFLGGLIGLVFPFLGQILLYLSYPMLWWFVSVVNLFTGH